MTMTSRTTILKMLIAALFIASPFLFPNLSPVLAPAAVVVTIALAMVGPRNKRNWRFKRNGKRRRILDDSSPNTTDLDPTNPFGMYDDYY